MTVKCLSRDAELIRLKNANEYAKCIAAFEKMKANIAPQANIELKPTSKPDLTLPQIALITVYEDTSITRKNGDDIAKKYGHNSGERLFQLFTKYSSRANRTGTETTRKKNLNKIKLFETVISKLSSKEAKQKATNEMNILKIALETEYQ